MISSYFEYSRITWQEKIKNIYIYIYIYIYIVIQGHYNKNFIILKFRQLKLEAF